MMKKYLAELAVAMVGALVLAFGAPAPGRAAEPIVLKGVTPWVASYYWSQPFLMFQRMVNTRLKGKVRVDYLGAGEVIPPTNQFEALRNGTVDVILGGSSYYSGEVPESMAGTFSKLAGTQLRANGFYDMIRRIHLEKGNVIYLASIGGEAGKAFRFFVRKKVDKADFSGLKFRVSPIYVDMVKALGGTPVVISPGEVYTALERGVIDGVAWSYGGIADFGWQELVKYVIDHPFYTGGSSILINKDTWDKLPTDVRDELEQIGEDLEVATEKFMASFSAKEDAQLRGMGLEFVRFSDREAEKYLSAAYDHAWKNFLAKNPETGPKLKALAE